ncbi:Glycine receptor subunit alpha-2 [Nymphon striatum]|nr:Glycine receptor subunit alpha-2 [Nymphon striatum]
MVSFLTYLLTFGALVQECAYGENFDDTCEESTQSPSKEKHLFQLIIPTSYDKHAHPNYINNNKTSVQMRVIISAITSVQKDIMQVDYIIWQILLWNDTRLHWAKHESNETDSKHFGRDILDHIWIPTLDFYPSKNVEIGEGIKESISVTVTGQLVDLYSMYHLSMFCPMDMGNYPFDQQVCSISMCSIVETSDEMDLQWGENPVYVSKRMAKALPEYNVTITNHLTLRGSKSRTYPCNLLKIYLKRKTTGLVFTIFTPSVLFVIISLLSLCIPARMVQPRITLGVTTVLTIVTLGVNSRSDLPPMANVRAIDIWFLVCFIFVTLVLVETIVVVFIIDYKQTISKTPIKLEKMAKYEKISLAILLTFVRTAFDRKEKGESAALMEEVMKCFESLESLWGDFESGLGVTARLWSMYIDMILILRRYIHAERAGLWQQHLQEVRNMLPYTIASGHSKYMSCLPIYLNEMQKLPETAPEVHEEFAAGKFTVHQTAGNFNGVWTDLAMAFIQRFNTLGSSTFGQLQERYRDKLLNMKPRHCTEVHFVGDQYDFELKSLKCDERQRQESNINLPEYVPADSMKIPDWKTLLSNPCNRTNMLSYLASRWSQEASWPAGFCLVLRVNAQATRVTQTEHTDVDELYCPNHEEADTRIFAHIASCDDNNVFVIQATDTDIIFLAMYHFPRLPNVVELWVEKNDLFLSIHDLVNELAKVSWKGRKRTVKVALEHVDKHPTLSNCIRHESGPSAHDQVITEARSFFCDLYGKPGYLSLDKLRAHLFASSKLDLRSLPPTEDAFHFHVLRSLCQICLYKQASLSNPVLLPPEEYGRIVDGDRLIPVMKSKPSKPSAAKLKYCKCKKKPNCLRNCPCAKAAVPCIIACACNGDREKCGWLLTDHYDDDDDDDDEEIVLMTLLDSLDKEVRDRYDEKLSLIGGQCPYEMSSDNFSNDVESLPNLTYIDILNYLVNSKSVYTLEQLKSYKSLEAYNQFVCGWVRDVRSVDINGRVLVTARVRHSQRMNDTPLKPWLIVDKSGVVEAAHCNCQAGLGEACTHVGALLFYIEAASRICSSKTVTQEKAYWLLPSSINKVPYSETHNIDFTSADTKKRKLDSAIDGYS